MKLSEYVERKHPPSYDELWMACVEYENHIAQLEEENAALKRENAAVENEIYNAIFYEPHETDSWGKITNKQLMALNDIGRRLAYKRQERALLTAEETE